MKSDVAFSHPHRTAIAMLSAVLLVSCSSTQNIPKPRVGTTATGALVGAGVGGGLGLVVGSTSGDAGEGMLVGSLAGGALGAGTGAKLAKDEENRAKTDTEIRQAESIRQQDAEINDLKKAPSDDLESFYDAPIRQPVLEPKNEMSKPVGVAKASRSSARARMSNGVEYLSPPSGERRAIPYSRANVENRYAALTPPAAKKPAPAVKKPIPKSVRADSFAVQVPEEKVVSVKPAAVTASTGLPTATTEAITDSGAAKAATAEAPKDLANCKDALKEAERGLRAASDADRLFYLRRAARLCPTEPSYHVELGKLYSAIGKSEDAKYELRQAIDLDPNNQVARDELSIIENTGGAGK